MKVVINQNSYGFDNSGAIYMSDRKLIGWCVITSQRQWVITLSGNFQNQLSQQINPTCSRYSTSVFVLQFKRTVENMHFLIRCIFFILICKMTSKIRNYFFAWTATFSSFFRLLISSAKRECRDEYVFHKVEAAMRKLNFMSIIL